MTAEVTLKEQEVEIPTADGTIDALLARPETDDTLPGVIDLTDGFGLRPAFADLSRRIAGRGYALLTPNIFYRTTKPPVFDFEPDFPSERTMRRFRELTGRQVHADGEALAALGTVSDRAGKGFRSASGDNRRVRLQE